MLILITAGMAAAASSSQSSPPKGRAGQKAAAPVHFQSSDRCVACHNGITTRSGENISFGASWAPTMMANAGRDPYWQAGVRREILDHPAAQAAIEEECSTCHMPMAHYEATLAGGEARIFAHLPYRPDDAMSRLALDGVSCSVCHRIEPTNFGKRESFVGRFSINTALREGERAAYGPFAVDAGRTTVMRSSSALKPTEGKHIRQSELCATCHTLYTKALVAGADKFEEFPEQVPYQEWLHSRYRQERSCQSCHMPVVNEEVPITSVLGQPHPGVARHTFLGGNFFMQRLFARYGPELGAAALPQDFENAAMRTIEHLQSESARVSIERLEVSSGVLNALVTVENMTGHKLPTAYPSRRAWLHFVVRDRDGKILFESGGLRPDGSIAGNDNDASPDRYEPHYTEISSPEQVQIYEPVLGDPAGRVTTGLLSAVQYVKDNRLLPHGLDKSSAPRDVAVHGAALQDPDFTAGGDRIRYVVALGQSQGPYEVSAELWYQPIGFRWAQNLKPYQAMEPQRFVRYYEAMSVGSAVPLARAQARR
jgi:hypothetical protein